MSAPEPTRTDLPLAQWQRKEALRAGFIAAQKALDPEVLRAAVVNGGAEHFVQGMIESLQPRPPCPTCKIRRYERWAFRDYQKIARLVGAEIDISLQLVQLVGASPDEARRAVERVKEAESDDVHALAAKAAEMLTWYQQRFPAEWERIMKPSINGVSTATVEEP